MGPMRTGATVVTMAFAAACVALGCGSSGGGAAGPADTSDVLSDTGLEDTGAADASDTLPPDVADVADDADVDDDGMPADADDADDADDAGETADVSGPSLTVAPPSLGFGAVAPGTTKTMTVTLSAGVAESVDITSVVTEGSTAFSVEIGGVTIEPATDAATTTSLNPAVTVAAGGTLEVTVEFAPLTAGDAAGTVTFVWDGGDPVQVTLSGKGADASSCPVPVIDVVQGTEVPALTTVELSGSNSIAPPGKLVAGYKWTVTAPAEACTVLKPASSVANVALQANVVGTYVFQLAVTDTDGTESCDPAEVTVTVTPHDALHVQLTWVTPGDEDPTDEGPEAGADLDLHFLLENTPAGGADIDGDGTPDGWFDQLFDTFWFNQNPNWGTLDPAVDDDPALARDDTDGCGPEVLLMTNPANDATYHLGVHYWNEHQKGPSDATLKVWAFQNLVYEQTAAELAGQDFWEAATLTWPAAVVTPQTAPGGGLLVTPGVVGVP